MLGNKDAQPLRLVSPPSQGGDAVLRFFLDYSSPWSYLACVRLRSVIEEVLPVRVKIEYIPILTRFMFNKIGKPVVNYAFSYFTSLSLLSRYKCIQQSNDMQFKTFNDGQT